MGVFREMMAEGMKGILKHVLMFDLSGGYIDLFTL